MVNFKNLPRQSRKKNVVGSDRTISLRLIFLLVFPQKLSGSWWWLCVVPFIAALHGAVEGIDLSKEN